MTISLDPNRTLANVQDGGLGNEFGQRLEPEFQKVTGLKRVEISAGKAEDGLIWVYAWSRADNVVAAARGVEIVLNVLAGGKEAFIRRRPEAETSHDFITEEVKHSGYVRFSFYDRTGTWHVNPPAPPS